MKIHVQSWVTVDSGMDEGEKILGYVVSLEIPNLPGYANVAWLSNTRGLWVNEELLSDLMPVARPELAEIEAIMVTATPTTPFGYEA